MRYKTRILPTQHQPECLVECRQYPTRRERICGPSFRPGEPDALVISVFPPAQYEIARIVVGALYFEPADATAWMSKKQAPIWACMIAALDDKAPRTRKFREGGVQACEEQLDASHLLGAPPIRHVSWSV